jgi:hypothetical protein
MHRRFVQTIGEPRDDRNAGGRDVVERNPRVHPLGQCLRGRSEPSHYTSTEHPGALLKQIRSCAKIRHRTANSGARYDHKSIGIPSDLLYRNLLWTSRRSTLPEAHRDACLSPIALTANVTGEVTLTLTIDADGKVGDVKATTDSNVPRFSTLLENVAVTNIRLWTFAKPPSAPYKQTIEYDYEIDRSLPLDGPTKVTFDLPERATIVARVTFAVDAARLHFFDLDTGDAAG